MRRVFTNGKKQENSIQIKLANKFNYSYEWTKSESEYLIIDLQNFHQLYMITLIPETPPLWLSCSQYILIFPESVELKMVRFAWLICRTRSVSIIEWGQTAESNPKTKVEMLPIWKGNLTKYCLWLLGSNKGSAQPLFLCNKI